MEVGATSSIVNRCVRVKSSNGASVTCGWRVVPLIPFFRSLIGRYTSKGNLDQVSSEFNQLARASRVEKVKKKVII